MRFCSVMTVTVGLILAGCATKKYVRNTAAPLEAKVDQVGEETGQNGQAIESARQQVKQVDQRAQSGISAAEERAATADQHAKTADQHASDAMNRANQADKLAEASRRQLGDLDHAVSNLDDYRLQTSATVPFGFDKYTLTKDDKQELDKFADEVKGDKRFFIAVEGFTDKTGSERYNEELSRRRADSVVLYLVAQHDIPIYRIQMVGLGEQKPVAEGASRTVNAKNRRVEVRAYTADQAAASLETGSSDSSANRSQAPQAPPDRKD